MSSEEKRDDDISGGDDDDNECRSTKTSFFLFFSLPLSIIECNKVVPAGAIGKSTSSRTIRAWEEEEEEENVVRHLVSINKKDATAAIY